jgi:hypothetical protein
MKTRSIILGLAIAGIALFLNAGTAYATTTHMFSGDSCKAAYGVWADNINTVRNYTINSNPYYSLAVTCPVVSTNPTNTLGTYWAAIRVQSANSAVLSCDLCSYGPLGATIQCTSVSTTSNVPIILFPDLSLSALVGTYSFHCVLPPQAKIFGYRVDEY